jgi:hypothetical protein
MRSLLALGVRLVFQPNGISDESVPLLFQLLEQYSAANASIPWRALRYYTEGEWSRPRWDEISDPVDFTRNFLISETESQAVGRDWGDIDVPIHEGIGLGRDKHFPLLSCTIHLMVEDVQRESFFVELCELLHPRYGWYLAEYFGAVGCQETILEMALERDFRITGGESDSPDVRLARAIAPLLPRMPFAIPNPIGLPDRLGWLNYWQPEVASELGFPDPGKDAALLPLSYRTGSGAWLVKLTEESLDLTHTDHLRAIAQAYWRFDKIGKRMHPTARNAKPRVKRAEARDAASVGLKVFILRERDEHGQWWTAGAEPIRARDAEEALRIYLAKNAHGRAPRSKESTAKLRNDYDGVAAEVGLTMSADVDVVEAEAGETHS